MFFIFRFYTIRSPRTRLEKNTDAFQQHRSSESERRLWERQAKSLCAPWLPGYNSGVFATGPPSEGRSRAAASAVQDSARTLRVDRGDPRTFMPKVAHVPPSLYQHDRPNVVLKDQVWNMKNGLL